MTVKELIDALLQGVENGVPLSAEVHCEVGCFGLLQNVAVEYDEDNFKYIVLEA